MRYIQKDYQTTPTTGVIEDSMESDSHSNAPSIKAVKTYVGENSGSANLPKGLGTFFDGEEIPQGWEEAETPISVPNLLINGDFQINQRGQSSYSASNDKVVYTVDMWRIVTTSTNTITCEVIDGGVRLTNVGDGEANFEQVLNIHSESHIAIGSFKNLSGSGYIALARDGVWDKADLINGDVILKSTPDSDFDRLVVRLMPNSSVEIEHLYLYEGDFLCRHIPEDKAIALIRCKSKVNVIDSVLGQLVSNEEKSVVHAVVNLPVSIDSTPTLNIISKGSCMLYDIASLTISNVSIFNFVSSQLYLYFEFSNKVDNSWNGSVVYTENFKAIVSCEP